MSSSDPQLPGKPEGSKPPITREIPVVAQPTSGATAAQHLPPHPGATTPAPVRPVGSPAPTGPVDFVPGPPAPGVTPPPFPPPTRPAPAAAASGPGPSAGAATSAPSGPTPVGTKRPRTWKLPAPRDRATALGIGLALLSLVLLQLGLGMRWDDVESYWQRIPLWSAFATVCAVLGPAPFLASSDAASPLRSGSAWRAAAAGVVGLAAFWVLVVLPVVATDRGFVLTAALAALGGALWMGRRRKD